MEYVVGPLEIWQSMTLIAQDRGGHPPLDVDLVAVRDHRAADRSTPEAKKQSLSSPRRSPRCWPRTSRRRPSSSPRKYKSSHLARVTRAGLIEFLYDQTTKPNPVAGHDVIEAAKRAIERETLIAYSDFKKGVGGLATIATTAPFIGLFGTVVGIINAFEGMALTGSGGIGAVSAGIAEALVTTALGLCVAIPAAWLFNYFTNVLERFQVEMSNSASELIDFFIKKQAAASSGRHAMQSGSAV